MIYMYMKLSVCKILFRNWSTFLILHPSIVFELFRGRIRSRALFDLKHLTRWQVSSGLPIVSDLACVRAGAHNPGTRNCSWCSRISESVGKTRKKGARKVSGAGKRKKEKGRDRVLSSPSFLPFYFRVRAFLIQRTRLSRSLEQASSWRDYYAWGTFS